MNAQNGSVILFGATGYTGQLTARALMRNGLVPVLAGRNPAALDRLGMELAEDFPDLPHPGIVLADAMDHRSVAGLISDTSDVVVSTVGPFAKYGEAAVRAATEAGAGYLDSTGEPPFIRRVFEEFGPIAEQTGARLLPAFGYDYVPGSLAATIALRRSMTAAHPPARVDIGYFTRGRMRSSAGTRASAAGVLTVDGFARRDGRLRSERTGAHVRSFDVGASRPWSALSVGGTEHLTLHRMAASVTDVNVYVGWAGRWSRAASVAGAAATGASRIPLVGGALESLTRTAVGPTTARRSGPDEEERGRSRTLCVAETFDTDGNLQHRVRVEGPSPYDLTASLLAWGARMMWQGSTHGTGALGPAEAMGAEALIGGCLALGLAEVR